MRAVVLAARARQVDQVHHEIVAAALERELDVLGEVRVQRLVIAEQFGHERDDDVASVLSPSSWYDRPIVHGTSATRPAPST